METKKVMEIIDLWKIDKKQYVKKSSYSAYLLLIENHLFRFLVIWKILMKATYWLLC
jgi:hypothetical protein